MSDDAGVSEETEGQLRLLRDMGVHLVQGYLVARPAPAAEVESHFGDGIRG